MTTPDLVRATPLRTCVGCRQRRPQSQMLRCAFGPDGPVVDRHAPGRGAWVCSAACLDTALRKGGFAKAWRRSLTQEQLGALHIAFHRVITNMEELPTAGDRPVESVSLKG